MHAMVEDIRDRPKGQFGPFSEHVRSDVRVAAAPVERRH